MKLIYCPDCGDIFNLRHRLKVCECGHSYGYYVDNITAKVGGRAVSVAIGNGSFMNAIDNFKQVVELGDNKAVREDYIKMANFIAWVRPNTGVGNPHTEEMEITKAERIAVALDISANISKLLKEQTSSDFELGLALHKLQDFLIANAVLLDKELVQKLGLTDKYIQQ